MFRQRIEQNPSITLIEQHRIANAIIDAEIEKMIEARRQEVIAQTQIPMDDTTPPPSPPSSPTTSDSDARLRRAIVEKQKRDGIDHWNQHESIVPPIPSLDGRSQSSAHHPMFTTASPVPEGSSRRPLPKTSQQQTYLALHHGHGHHTVIPQPAPMNQDND